MKAVKAGSIHRGRLALALSCVVMAAWFVFATVGRYGELGTRYATNGAIVGGHLLLLNISLAAVGLRRRERPRWLAITAIFLSALPALFAVYADGWLLANAVVRSMQKSEVVQVLVTRRDLPAGHMLEASDLETRAMRVVTGQPRFILSQEAAAVMGRNLLFPLGQRRPLRWDGIEWGNTGSAPSRINPHPR